MFLLSFQQIYICYGKCFLLDKLLSNNAYNLKIALGVSGLIRKNDDISYFLLFIENYQIDKFYYLTLEDKKKLPEKFSDEKYLLYDNEKMDNLIAKHKQPNTKDDMVANSCQMFRKKRRLYDMIPKTYDIIIHMRPDLVSMDGKCLLHIMIDILSNYDSNAIYLPKFYNSFGVADTMAIGSFHIMEKYLKLYDKMNIFLSEYIFNPEYLVYKHLTENSIEIKPFDWVHRIYHHPE